ncbi:MAG: hypothetical protein QOF76_4260 [Solirubrobacteraceae bacterium]|jgi:plastocyanin|nr:hypothetical protein [Solirubrobacteraceae bacterium]
MRARAVSAIAAAALATVAVAGCGGSDSSSDSTTSKPASSGGAAAPSTTTKSGAAPNSATAGMKDFEFVPDSVTVAAGGKVTWTDHDSANHNVTFKTAGAPDGISNLNQDETGSVKFAKAGTYEYVCTYHPNMHGTVVVR